MGGIGKAVLGGLVSTGVGSELFVPCEQARTEQSTINKMIRIDARRAQALTVNIAGTQSSSWEVLEGGESSDS